MSLTFEYHVNDHASTVLPFIINAAAERPHNFRAKVSITVNKSAKINTKQIKMDLPFQVKSYQLEGNSVPKGIDVGKTTSGWKYQCTYTPKETFEPNQDWIEMMTDSFSIGTSMIELKLFHCEETGVLHLSTVTVYSNQRSDIKQFTKASRDNSLALRKVWWLKKDVRGISLEKSEKILSILDGYPTRLSESAQDINLPNIRNKYGYEMVLNDIPSFSMSPVSKWVGEEAHNFLNNHIEYILDNNKSYYVGVRNNADNARKPVSAAVIQLEHPFDPLGLFHQLTIKYPCIDSELTEHWIREIIGHYASEMLSAKIKELNIDGTEEMTQSILFHARKYLSSNNPLPSSMESLLALSAKSTNDGTREPVSGFYGVVNDLIKMYRVQGLDDYHQITNHMASDHITIIDQGRNFGENDLATLIAITKSEIELATITRCTTFTPKRKLGVLHIKTANKLKLGCSTKLIHSRLRKLYVTCFLAIDRLPQVENEDLQSSYTITKSMSGNELEFCIKEGMTNSTTIVNGNMV